MLTPQTPCPHDRILCTPTNPCGGCTNDAETELAQSAHLGLIAAPWTVRPHPEPHGRQHPFLWSCDHDQCEAGGVGVNAPDAHRAAATHHFNQHTPKEPPVIGIIDTATVLAMLSPDVDDCAADGETVVDTLPAKRGSGHYPGLLEEIARDGITVPVVIRRDPSGDLWLMEGHHRVAAAVDLGLPTVPWTDVPLDVDHGACYRQMRSPWSGYATAPA